MSRAAAFLVVPEEIVRLRGVGLVEISLYMLCFKGHTDADGFIIDASYNGLAKALEPRDSRAGGRRRPAPTVHQVRDAIERLQAAGLIQVERGEAKAARELRLRLLFPGHVET